MSLFLSGIWFYTAITIKHDTHTPIHSPPAQRTNNDASRSTQAAHKQKQQKILSLVHRINWIVSLTTPKQTNEAKGPINRPSYNSTTTGHAILAPYPLPPIPQPFSSSFLLFFVLCCWSSLFICFSYQCNILDFISQPSLPSPPLPVISVPVVFLCCMY